MASPYMSQIIMFGGNFAPKNYALCNGTLMPINQYQALFALLGTNYGGNGTTNFGLPNLQSALSMSFGQGSGLSPYGLGQTGGVPQVTLTQQTVPSHQHFMLATKSPVANASAISTSVLPGVPPASGGSLYANPPTGSLPPLVPHPLAAGTCSPIGNDQPHTNLMPSLCVTFAIALTGVFPSRN
jgi:microcystin-dependent protein